MKENCTECKVETEELYHAKGNKEKWYCEKCYSEGLHNIKKGSECPKCNKPIEKKDHLFLKDGTFICQECYWR